MASAPLQLTETLAIRMVFQRVCQAGGELRLVLAGRESPFPLLAEAEGRLVLGITAAEREKAGLAVGSACRIVVYDRQRKLAGLTQVADIPEGVPELHLEQPRTLQGPDYRGLADLVPDKPFKALYTTPALDFAEARVRALGEDGVQLPLYGSDAVKEGTLQRGAPTTLDLPVEPGVKFTLAAATDTLEEGFAAVRFSAKADPQTLADYRSWLRAALAAQARRDREAFQSAGMRARPEGAEKAAAVLQATLLADHDPLLLVIGEEGLTHRLAESLGRKFGIAALDYARGEVRPACRALGAEGAGWGRVKLILVHQRLRLGSGMDLARQLTQVEGCQLPVLVMGSEDELETKRNRALTCGAVDFLVVEPFKVLSVIRGLDDTLKMFA